MRLVPLNLAIRPWNLAPADVIYLGNIFHRCTDTEVVAGARIWLHEVLMNDNRDGLLMAALLERARHVKTVSTQ